MTIIEPTVGRIVWFRAHPEQEIARGPHPTDQPLAAQIARVNEDGTVNLGVLGSDGVGFPVQSVPLLQDGEDVPDGHYAEWMPYQKEQAAKSEPADQEPDQEPDTESKEE